MMLDSLMYILASTMINEGFAKIHKITIVDHDNDNAWSKDKEHEGMEKIIEKTIGVWKVCAPKIIVVINPLFGDFLKTCLAMHTQCKREKLLGSIPIQCGLYQTRLYIGVMLHPYLWCKLLTTECTRSL